MAQLSVAGACCAHLLRGYRVKLTPDNRPRVPALVVSGATQTLLCDVFRQPDLFRDLPRIERRIVAWGPAAEPVSLPHSAVVISEAELIARLHPGAEVPLPEGEWTIFASRPLPPETVEHRFGSRTASAVAVDLAAPGTAACWVESLERGWLFLLPGFLIAVGGSPGELLAQSRLVASKAVSIRGEPAGFAAYPRIAEPLCGPGWLACGSAAMAFDPICGDGTGNAVREAILAAAVIRAVTRGEDVDSLLRHYQARLVAGFRRHLEHALAFYRRGHGGEWWDHEARALQSGLEWCSQKLAATPPFRYRLNGFELERVAGK
jgi:hypothetical protein